ncbi:MAG: hypothetical protein ACR2KV_14300 [Solirubrobacteraceae bacterium]
MPEDRKPPPPGGANTPVWRVLRLVAPVLMAIGTIGAVVGLIAAQPVGIVALDVMIAVVGAIVVLILRWRR